MRLRAACPTTERPPLRTLLSAAVLAVVAQASPAQSPPQHFAQLRKTHLPLQDTAGQAIAWGDVDGDGDLDLAVGNGNPFVGYSPPFGGATQTRLYRNDGHGVFTDVTATAMPVDAEDTSALAFVDVDADGDLDLVVGNGVGHAAGSPQNRLYVNDGSGHFADETAARLPADALSTKSIAVGDIDGDGDLDLVTGNGIWIFQTGGFPVINACSSEGCRLYVNDGTGHFRDAAPGQLLQPHATAVGAVALGDVDSDGDLDLVAGGVLSSGTYYPGYGASCTSQSNLYLNDGAGTFTEVTATQWPSMHTARALRLGDVDGDGDLDMVSSDGATLLLDRNDGTGVFSATQVLSPSGARAVALGDVDGDGDLDVVTPGQLLQNDGTGTFSIVATPGVGAANAAELGDADGDGDLDLMLGFNGWDRLFFCSGGAYVDPNGYPQTFGGAKRVACGDIDGDGDTDLIVDCTLYCFDGVGRFAWRHSWQNFTPTGFGLSALVDVDGDGDLDLVIPKSAGEIHLNNGAGFFTPGPAGQLPYGGHGCESISAGDVDGDGDVDLVLGRAEGYGDVPAQNRLLLNNGTGTFTNAASTHLPPLLDETNDTALLDVDGDGDLDLIVSNGDDSGGLGTHVRLLRNDGAGFFAEVTATQMPILTRSVRGIATGDVDGDGDVDLVAGVWGQNELLLNDGSGTFSLATTGHLPVINDATWRVALADADADGDLDLLAANVGFSSSGEPSRLLRNDGTGVFTDATADWLPMVDRRIWGLAFTDFDGDQDADVFLAGLGARNESIFYTNTYHQLHTPRRLRSGQPFEIEAYSHGAPPGVTTFALPFASLTRVSIPLPPHGTLGISPDFGLGFAAVSPNTGIASLTVNVPAAPSLTGLVVFTQAGLWSTNGDLLLTNVTRDVVIP